MNSISAVIITYNEEENIVRCIQSLKSVADEVIVVDSFSTDRTRKLATDWGAKVFERAWEGYSFAKNFGNEQATNHWILSIDADEALSPELITSLQAFKENTYTHDAYEVNRLTNYCGHWVRYCGWYPDRKMRMWKKDAGRWDGVLHEKVLFKNSVKINRLKGDLYHYSFPTIHHHVQTLNKYSEVAAQDLVDRKKPVFFLIHIILNPSYTFFNKYFLRLGFLDGYYGFVICWLSAQANFLKYSKAFFRKRSIQAS